MKELEIAVLKELLATLELERARQQFGNEYVFGYDDVVRVINRKINRDIQIS